MRETLPILLQTVADNLNRLLEETARTQRMAAGSGVSQKTVSNVSTMGSKTPKRGSTVGTLHNLAEQLGIPTYQLLIENLPQNSRRRKQLDVLIRAFVTANEAQQDWLIQTLELMAQFRPKQ